METETERQCRMPPCGACAHLHIYFKKSGKWWYAEGTDGTVIPILFCPVCGRKVEGGE